MNNSKKGVIQITVSLVLIFWQLFIWFQFAPGKYGDPYIDLAPMFYYFLGIPAGLLGGCLSFIVIRNKEVMAGQKVLAWVLMMVSICTAIPPVFLWVRYIFSPLVIFLGG